MDRFNPEGIPLWLASTFAGQRGPGVVTDIDDDDCAVVAVPTGLLVLTTDFINSRPAIEELGLATPYDLGRLVVAQNLSDLVGTCATPVCLLVGVCLPFESKEEAARQLMAGAYFEANRFGVPIVGGDTKAGQSRSIFGVGVGTAPDSQTLLQRSKARDGHDLWISGPVGDFAAAVLALTSLNSVGPLYDWAKASILDIRVPLGASQKLAKLRLDGAGTDLTDGLGRDVADICRSSGLGVEINVESIPLSSEAHVIAQSNSLPGWTLPFSTGGDFQFIWSAPPSRREDILGLGFSLIGVFNATGKVRLIGNHTECDLPESIGHASSRQMPFSSEIMANAHALRELRIS